MSQHKSKETNMKIALIFVAVANGLSCFPVTETKVLIPDHKPCYIRRREDRKITKFNKIVDYPVAVCQKNDMRLYATRSWYWTGSRCHDPITGTILSYLNDSTIYDSNYYGLADTCAGEVGHTCKDVREKELRENRSWYNSWGIPPQCTGPNKEYWREKQHHECGCWCVNKYTGIITQTGPRSMECPKFNKFGKLTAPVVTNTDYVNYPVVSDYYYDIYSNLVTNRVTRNSTCYGKYSCY